MRVPRQQTGEEIRERAQKEQTQDFLTISAGLASLLVLLSFSVCCRVEAPRKAQAHWDRFLHKETMHLEVLRRIGNGDIWLHRYGTLITPFFAAIGVFIVRVLCVYAEVMCGIKPKGQLSGTVQKSNYATGQEYLISRNMPLMQQPQLSQENALIATRNNTMEVGALYIAREAQVEIAAQQCNRDGEWAQGNKWSGTRDKEVDSAVLRTTLCPLRSCPSGCFVWQCIEFCRLPTPSRLSRHPRETLSTVFSTITINFLDLRVYRSTEKIRGSRWDGGIPDSDWGPNAIQVRFPHFMRVPLSRVTRGRLKTQRWWSKRF